MQPTYFRLKLTAGALCAAALCAAPQAAHAQAFQITFAPALQSVLPGQSVTFSGTITNLTTSDLYINGDALDPLAFGLSADDTPFQNTFGGAPVLLMGGQSYMLTDLFTVTDTTAAIGTYPGQFSVIGGTAPDSTDQSGFQKFTVNVPMAPVPEASSSSSLALLLLGGGAALALRRRKSAHA